MDELENVVDKVLEKHEPKKIEYDFDNSSHRVLKCIRYANDKCTTPPKVSDWKYNRRRVDDAGYVPLDKMIKRMIADGQRLEDFKASPQYRAIYEQLDKLDEQIPTDDFLYLSRTDLLAKAHELKRQLESYHQEPIETPAPVPEKNPSSAEKETVSTPASDAGSSE